jgi:hypothetical protein
MGSASHITLAVFFGIVGLYAIRRLVQSRRNALPLPPGPKGVPLLGNIYDMPKSDVLEAFHWLKHKDLYGTFEQFPKYSSNLQDRSRP